MEIFCDEAIAFYAVAFFMPSARYFFCNSPKKVSKKRAATALSLFGVLQLLLFGDRLILCVHAFAGARSAPLRNGILGERAEGEGLLCVWNGLILRG